MGLKQPQKVLRLFGDPDKFDLIPPGVPTKIARFSWGGIKLALPKGHLLKSTSLWLKKIGLELEGYDEDSRSYRPRSNCLPDLSIKMFHEKDIPIQVAVGNYDLGICGLDWIEELLVKYPSSALVKVKNLGYGKRDLYITSSKLGVSSIEELKAKVKVIRIATEYPNLAESWALKLRLKGFKIFPVWGAAEVYPPESTDLALIPASPASLSRYDLFPLALILNSNAFLIANRHSWEGKDMGVLLQILSTMKDVEEEEEIEEELPPPQPSTPNLGLALPDGHLQKPTIQFLNEAGIRLEGYLEGLRRPTINIGGVSVKVIRPQDMPLQVANGNFDLAICGEDWLYDHLHRFPSSPVRELLKLGFGRVRIVAIVSRELPVENIQELRELVRKGGVPYLRIASEYINIADKYARDNHLSPYRIIPTWGASEAFLPEDADLLIENTQTGKTLAEHNLKIIDTLFESSACLIANANILKDSPKGEKITSLIQIFTQGLTI